MSEELIGQARRDYGELILKIVAWPPGLGIDVHLIGGGVVQYYPGGGTYVVDQPSVATKMRRRVVAIHGAVNRRRRRL